MLTIGKAWPLLLCSLLVASCGGGSGDSAGSENSPSASSSSSSSSSNSSSSSGSSTTDFDRVDVGQVASQAIDESNNELNVNGLARVVVHTIDASLNPTLTLSKKNEAAALDKINNLVNELDIQDFSKYEVTLDFDIRPTYPPTVELNVPVTLLDQINENTALVTYIETPAGNTEPGSFVPISSTLYTDTNFLVIELPTWAFFEVTGAPPSYQVSIKMGIANASGTSPSSPKPIVLEPQGEFIQSSDTAIPCPLSGGCVEVSRVGPRTGGAGDYHKGIDLRAALNTPFNAVEAGTVRYPIDINNTFGVVYIVDTNNVWYMYVHAQLSSLTHAEGAAVTKGEQLGLTGATHPTKTINPHLHFEVIGKEPRVASIECTNSSASCVSKSTNSNNDPFPLFISSAQIIRVGDADIASEGETFDLRLETHDHNMVQISSEIDNTKGDIVGSLRKVNWESSNPSALELCNKENADGQGGTRTCLDSDVRPSSPDRNIGSALIKNEAELTISANWEGSSTAAMYKIELAKITLALRSGPPPERSANGEYEYWTEFHNTSGLPFSYSFKSEGVNYACTYNPETSQFFWKANSYDNGVVVVEDAYQPPTGMANSVPYYFDEIAYVAMFNGTGGYWTNTTTYYIEDSDGTVREYVYQLSNTDMEGCLEYND